MNDRSSTRWRWATRAMLVGALATASTPARADLFHYNSQLLGARAAGMGGAVVGMPEDDASGFYNPAAYLRSDQIKASVSATAFDVESLTYLQYLGAPATATSVGIIPNATVASVPWQGGRVSLSVFATDDTAWVLDRSPLPGAPAAATLHQTQDTSSYLIGPSIAMPLSPQLSVGISIYLVYASQSVLEQTLQGSTSRTAGSTDVSTGVTVVAGLRYQPQGPAGRFTLGLAIRSGASLADQATQDLVTDGGASPTSGQSSIPSEVSVGGSMRIGSGRVAADATAYSGQSYTDLGVPVTKDLTFNAAAGYEWSLGPTWMARAGLYTDRSSAPHVPAPDNYTAYTEPHVDYYGATLGLSQFETHHTIDVGLKFSYGYGHAVVLAPDGALTATGVRGYALTLTFGGAFRL